MRKCNMYNTVPGKKFVDNARDENVHAIVRV